MGNAAKRVLAGGGIVTVDAGKVSYWIMVFVSISAIKGGSSCSKQDHRQQNCSIAATGDSVGGTEI